MAHTTHHTHTHTPQCLSLFRSDRGWRAGYSGENSVVRSQLPSIHGTLPLRARAPPAAAPARPYTRTGPGSNEARFPKQTASERAGRERRGPHAVESQALSVVPGVAVPERPYGRHHFSEAPAQLRRRGSRARVCFGVVGRAEHGYHHVLGSVPQALERHDHFPVLVIP